MIIVDMLLCIMHMQQSNDLCKRQSTFGNVIKATGRKTQKRENQKGSYEKSFEHSFVSVICSKVST